MSNGAGSTQNINYSGVPPRDFSAESITANYTVFSNAVIPEAKIVVLEVLDTLMVHGVLTTQNHSSHVLTVTGSLVVPVGSLLAPALVSALDSASGLYFPATGQVSLIGSSQSSLSAGAYVPATAKSTGAFHIGSLAADPTGAKGDMYYNTVDNKFKVYEGTWRTITTT